MKINMYDVKFGDCFIFENDNESNSLIIDCGSKMKKADMLPKVDEIIELHIENKQRCEALITHFHVDHIKGFQYMYIDKNKKDIFDKFYIPYILTTDEEGVNILAEEVIFLYLTLSSISKGFIIAKSLLEYMHMVNSLVKHSKDIVCLYSDKIFSFDNVNYKVIWPDKEREVSRRARENCIHRIDVIKDLFKTDEEINGIVFKFKENMKRWFEQLENNDNNNEEKEAKIRDILEKQSKVIEKLNEKRRKFDSKKLTQNQKKSLYYLSKDLSKTMNENSIVFHNEISDNNLAHMNILQEAILEKNEKIIQSEKFSIYFEEDNNFKYPILMMGDITTKIIDRYLKYRFYNINYEYVKVPHHGTKTHYSENIPKCYNFLISTGKFGNYNGICDRYQLHKMVGGRRICTSGYINTTNNNCEVKKSGKCCSNGQCNTGSMSKHILRYNNII